MATTTKKTATNRYGIVEKFSNTKDNHPWVKINGETSIATVTIPNGVAKNANENIIIPYNVKEAGLIERWLKKSIVQNVKETATALTFECHSNYLNGKFWPSK